MPYTTTTSDTDTATLVIPKSQVAMLSKNGDTLVDQVGNSYSKNALMLSDFKSLDLVISKPTANEDTDSPYLLQPSLSPSYSKEEIPSSKMLASPMSSGERNKVDDTNDPSEFNDNTSMRGGVQVENVTANNHQLCYIKDIGCKPYQIRS